MNAFWLYLEMGIDHVLDINGMDHILFVIALCAIYSFNDWKKITLLIGAFIVGHSLTLSLSVYGIVSVNTALVEFLIPVTIFVTAFTNIVKKERSKPKKYNINYLLSLFFGLIHGLGFSNYLKSIMGKKDLLTQIIAFNSGVALGVVVAVIAFMLVTALATGLLGSNKRDWKIIVSSAVGGIAITLMIETAYW